MFTPLCQFHLIFRIPTLYHWIYLCPIIAAAHILVVYLFDYWPLFGATLLYGIPFGVTVAQVPAIMYEAAGLSRYPRAIALMNLMYGIGNFCGGVMGGTYVSCSIQCTINSAIVLYG